MPERSVFVDPSADVRRARIGATTPSSAASLAGERPYDAPLTLLIAEELLGQCRQLGLDGAAEVLQMALVALATVPGG